MDKSKIATIASFDSSQEATIAKGILESAGITCALLHDMIQGVLPLQNEMTRIDLCVAPEDEERAKKLLEAKFDREEFAAATKTARKPACKQ